MSLFDEQTLMENHDAAVARKAAKEATKKSEQNTTEVMAYLFENGRGEDIKRASKDDAFREKLLKEYREFPC